MDAKQLGLEPGQYVVSNCAKMPSENNCKLVIMAPQDQKEDLLDAAVAHAVKHHSHEDTPELREEVGKSLETVTIE